MCAEETVLAECVEAAVGGVRGLPWKGFVETVSFKPEVKE